MRRIGLLTVCLALHGAAGAGPLQLYAPDLPPLITQAAPNAPASGIVVGLLQHLAVQAGNDIQIHTVPWIRALETARTTPGACVVGLRKYGHLVPQFQWVGPLFDNPIAIYGRDEPDAHTLPASALRGRVVGVVRGSALALTLQDMGAVPEFANDAAGNIRKLLARRIDYVILNASAVKSDWPAGSGIHAFKVLEVNVPLNYLACHPSVSPELLARWQQELGRLRESGYLKRLGLLRD